MKKIIECKYIHKEILCKNKHIKRSIGGFGPRYCGEYDGTFRICQVKEFDPTKGGRYLVKFVTPKIDVFGRAYPNTFKSAKVAFRYTNEDIVSVNWDNGSSCVMDKKYLKFKQLR